MSQKFYQVGGSLPPDIPSYICREADKELYFYLKEKKYCYVLNARQVGKSSLRIRTSKTLEQEGYCCINIDITSIGSNDISADEWYFSLIDNIIEQLALEEDEFVEWWEESANLTPVRRFAKAFEKFILNASEEEIIIFIDEVDSILGVNNFSTDDFFAVIRTFYNLRAESPQYNRITFALFGVATPEDLMRDSSRTPFNIAHSVTIEPFELEASLSLTNGLKKQTVDPKKILERVFYYTEGMPYLTQKILEYISLNPINEIKEIEEIIQKLFIKEGTNEKNLRNVQKRIINNKKYNIRMINIVARVLQGESIKVDDGDLRHIYLKLSGLLSNQNGLLKYSNRIYKRVFDKAWLEEVFHKINRPFASDLHRWLELERDPSALLKGEVLIKAKEWAEIREDLTPIEHRFLNKSIEAEIEEKSQRTIEEEKKRSDRKMIHILGIAFLISLFSSIIIYNLYSDTMKQKELLKQEKELAEKSKRDAIRQKKEAERHRHIAEDKTKKLQSANNIIRSSVCQQSTHKTGFYENNIIAYKVLLETDSSLYTKNITQTYLDLTQNCITEKEYSCVKTNYKYLLEWNQKLKESNLSTFDNSIANISKGFAKLYEDKNQNKEAIELYLQALQTYKKNPLRNELKRAQIYYTLSSLYFDNQEKEVAIIYHNLGYKIYQKLLLTETHHYLPKLAERFEWLAKITQKEKRKIKNYHKALTLYQYLDQDDLLDFQQKITLLQEKIAKIPKPKTVKKQQKRHGWIYIGTFVNKEWEEQLLGFDKNSYTPPMLKLKREITIRDMRVRQKASKNGKVVNSIEIGREIKILEIRKVKPLEKGYFWAFVEFLK